jgi:UDP-2,3-diacylglucosamine hydrolase
MSVYLASDMHLRLDRPDRGVRLARWVDTLGSEDSLHLVGDVCDFWFATRQLPREGEPIGCAGLEALARFSARGGSLTIMPGNHDRWLGSFYEQALGARFVSEPRALEAHGLRLYVVHGHRAGGRAGWKAGMETRAFYESFRRIPSLAADELDRRLDRSNEEKKLLDEARHLAAFRRHAAAEAVGYDLAVFGHVHTPLDDPKASPRLVILGGWHYGASYLRVDDRGATLAIEPALSPAAV